MTVPSSTSVSSPGWDRLQGLFNEFRTEQAETERFLADTLEWLTRAAVQSVEDRGSFDAAGLDSRLEQLIAAGQQNRAAVEEACRSAETQADRFAQATAESQRHEAELLQALQQDRDALRAAEIAAQLQVEQLTETIRKGFEELISTTHARGAAQEAFQATLAETIQQERAATQQAIQAAVGQLVREYQTANARTREENRGVLVELMEHERAAATDMVESAVAVALDQVVEHALEQQSSLLAKGLEEHRAMMGLAVETLRNACEGVPLGSASDGTTSPSSASDTGTVASPATGAVPDSHAAPVGDAVLDSIRAQYQLVQRQNARRRKPGAESGS